MKRNCAVSKRSLIPEGARAEDSQDRLHLSLRPVDRGTMSSQAAWDDLRAGLRITSANRTRFDAARRTSALGWLAVLWKQRHRRVDEVAHQYQQAHDLLR